MTQKPKMVGPLQVKSPSLVPFAGVKSNVDMGSDVEGPGGSNITMEWDPREPGEQLEGMVTSMNQMHMGGIAIVLAMCDGQWNILRDNHQKAVEILFKKGGGWLKTRLQGFVPPIAEGQYVRIRYIGSEPPSQPDHSPMRMFEIARRKLNV